MLRLFDGQDDMKVDGQDDMKVDGQLFVYHQ